MSTIRVESFNVSGLGLKVRVVLSAPDQRNQTLDMNVMDALMLRDLLGKLLEPKQEFRISSVEATFYK